MKKIFISLILLILILTSCTKTNETIKIITPQGAPLLTQIELIEQTTNIADHKIEMNVVNGVDPIKAAFANESHDIILSPVNLGVILNNKQMNFNYQLLSVVTKGNIYLASTCEIKSFESLIDKKIVLFGEGTINDYVVKEIFQHYNLNNEISYLGSTQLTNQQLVAAKEANTVYLVAEPLLTAATLKLKSQNKTVYKLDITEEFKKMTGLDFYQAAVYAKKELSDDIKIEYLKMLESGIKNTNENIDDFAKKAQKYSEYGMPSENVLKLSVKGSNLCCIKETRTNLNKLIEKFPKAFGNSGVLTDEFFF